MQTQRKVQWLRDFKESIAVILDVVRMNSLEVHFPFGAEWVAGGYFPQLRRDVSAALILVNDQRKDVSVTM